MIELVQKLFLGFAVCLWQVEYNHAREEVGPQECVVREILMSVEEYYLFPILSSHLVSRDIDERFWIFA